MGIDYTALFPVADGSAFFANDILTSLYGSANGGANALAALTLAERTQTRQIASVAAQPQVKRALDRFTSAVAKAKDATTLLANPDVLNVLLTAGGLGSQTGYPALARKALLSDPADKSSLASRLSDPRWKALAQTYQFATKGLAVLRDPKVLATLRDGYAEVAWRTSLDATTPGLSNALDFRARAAKIGSVDEILGDATFRTVVTAALGIPAQIAYQELGAQERAISTRLDLKRLQDPKFVESFTQRYLLSAQAQAQGAASTSLDALAVQAGGLVV